MGWKDKIKSGINKFGERMTEGDAYRWKEKNIEREAYQRAREKELTKRGEERARQDVHTKKDVFGNPIRPQQIKPMIKKGKRPGGKSPVIQMMGF